MSGKSKYVKEANRWFEQALEDLKSANILFENERYYLVCFISQQIVEKALKSVIFFNKEDLEVVKNNIQNISFVTNWNENTKNERKQLLISFQGGLKNFVKLLQQGLIENIDEVENMKFRQNSLEDVFLNLTGRRLRD